MSSKDPYKSIFGSNATDRSVMTPDELDLMDGLCQEADKYRHLTMERASVVLIARLARELGDCRKRATTSPSLGKRSELPDHLRGEERELYIHRHDCPVAWASYDKHVLGLLERPSCFACGNVGDRAIEHLELADIYICVTCKTKLDAPAAPSPSLGEPSAERIQFVHGLQLLLDKFYRFHAGAMNRHEVSAFQICKNELSAFMETVKSGSMNQIPASPTAAQCECPQHGRWLAADDIYRMVRELDVAMNGKSGAAKQSGLCDIFAELKEYIAVARAGAVVPAAQGQKAVAWRAWFKPVAGKDRREYWVYWDEEPTTIQDDIEFSQFQALFASPIPASGWVMVNVDLVKFLLGEGEYMGQYFGDNTGRAKYWWRKYLRGSLPAVAVGETK